MNNHIDMTNEELFDDMRAIESVLSNKRVLVRERVRHIFERYVTIYNKYHVPHINVEDFNVFAVMENYLNNDAGQLELTKYIYISNHDKPHLELELDIEYFFNTDSALEFLEQTLKMGGSDDD